MRDIFQKSIIKVALEGKLWFNKQIQGRARFFIVGVVRHWKKMPREAVDASSLHVFKVRLDGALEQPNLGEGISVHDREVETRYFKVTSNPNHSMIISLR